jgi:hypothetical protein
VLGALEVEGFAVERRLVHRQRDAVDLQRRRLLLDLERDLHGPVELVAARVDGDRELVVLGLEDVEKTDGLGGHGRSS